MAYVIATHNVPARVRERSSVKRFGYPPAPPPMPLDMAEYTLGDIGELDLSLKKIVRSVTKAVRQVGRVVLRTVPGAVAGLVTGGPVGAVVGAAAGYEAARRAGGHGLHISGSQLLKSVGMGAGAGAVTSAAAGAVARVAPGIATRAGLAWGSGTGVYTTGVIEPISSAAFKVGSAIASAPSVALKTIGTALAMKTALLPAGPAVYPSTGASDVPVSSGATSLPAAGWSIPGVASDSGSEYFSPSVVPGSSGGFTTPEGPFESDLAAYGEPGIAGIPWKYLALGAAGLAIVYILARPART